MNDRPLMRTSSHVRLRPEADVDGRATSAYAGTPMQRSPHLLGLMSRYAPVIWTLAVLVFNLAWYGILAAFPLIDEDGAANYSSLVEAIRYTDWSSLTRFPIKWLEGMGQANGFQPLIFDPFAWIMLVNQDLADLFRISYALRATACWVLTYLFVAHLFRGARGLALTSASLCLLMNFTLANGGGSPTFAGITVATQVALFPGLLLLYRKLMSSRIRPGRWDALFTLILILFFLSYPLQSVVGFAVLLLFGVSQVLASPRFRRREACVAFGKSVFLGAAVLFAPWVGIYWTWSALVNVSARVVFADELTTYPLAYQLPYFWQNVPNAMKALIILALCTLLLNRRLTPPLRATLLTLALTVAGSQLGTIARTAALFGGALERLPRPFYVEFYLPIFYSISAAYALYRWRRPAEFAASLAAGSFKKIRWWRIGGVALFTISSWLLTGPWFVAGCAGLLLARYWAVAHRSLPRQWVGPRRVWLLPFVATVALFVATWLTWLLQPVEIHPLFGPDIVCRHRVPWCQDPPGLTMGASATPVTDYLQQVLPLDGTFRGRAEYYLTTGLKLGTFPLDAGMEVSPEEFEMLNHWYLVSMADENPLAVPRHFTYADRDALILALQARTTAGLVPQDNLLEIIDWVYATRQTRIPATRILGWPGDFELEAMVRERRLNYRATGNGMLLRALPFQGIPVASSYEQSLDYLYYLFWTRYVNEGFSAPRSINMTQLEEVYGPRLALMGVRLLVGRDQPRQPTTVDLPTVWQWGSYRVFEVPNPNTQGYGVTQVLYAQDLADELRVMRDPSFDPASAAVVSESQRSSLEKGGIPLSGLGPSSIQFTGQSLHFVAESPGRSLAVLPFKYSHCWQPTWSGAVGSMVRVDTSLIGVQFDKKVDLTLHWTAGYGPDAACLQQDAALIPQARIAAKQLS